MFGLGKSNEEVMQDEEARKAAAEAGPEAEVEAKVEETPAPEVTPSVVPEVQPVDVNTEEVAVVTPAVNVDPIEQVTTADAATAEVTKVDPATGEDYTETVELTGDFPPFPSDHKTSPNFAGHKYQVTALADFGDFEGGKKQVVVGYTHHSNGGGLIEYVDTHPLYSNPVLHELSFEEQIEIAKTA